MKFQTRRRQAVKSSIAVGNVPTGSCVQFVKTLCSYPREDVYLVLHVPDAYAEQSKHGCATDKAGVANLSTGVLSFVKTDRQVKLINAEVNINGPIT